MRIFRLLIPLMVVSLMACNSHQDEIMLSNADQTIVMRVQVDTTGRLWFAVRDNDSLVLDTCYLGVVTDQADLSAALAFQSVEGPLRIHDHYTLWQGKQQSIEYNALQYLLTFTNKDGIPLVIRVNLSAHGLAWRYEVDELSQEPVVVTSETSSFGFPASARGWLQPMSVAKTGWCEVNPSYEEHYLMDIPLSEPSPLGQGWVFPALIQSAGTWMVISETGLEANYCGSHLQYNPDLKGLQVTFPQAGEVFTDGGLLPVVQGPLVTPWRIIAMGSLADVAESTLGTDLANPVIDMDTDFIAAGLSSWSWVLLKDDFTNEETSRKFIDYASRMRWPYCLIDADWDQKIGYEKMQTLVDYARDRNVGILLWYNSSGDWNSTVYSPKSELLDPASREAVFSRLEQMGVAGCKIDFFGGDGQSMIAYYHDLLKDAARHHLMLNFHGATLPRGWQRTYPHLMTTEAIKGEEFITFEQANADLQPSHCAMLPFTRNVFDPMDFTPMVLDSIPGITRVTTTSFELALPVLFTSGIQHMAEIPEGMAKMPEEVQGYLTALPALWDETRFVDGYPGKEVVIARRKGDYWYVAGINGESSEKTVELDLSFVNQPEGLLFSDQDSKLPAIGTVKAGKVEVTMHPNGGFVMLF